MGRSLRCALALLVPAAASPQLQEASVLVQQAARLHGRQEPEEAAAAAPEAAAAAAQPPPPHVCSEEEYKAYESVNSEYLLKVKSTQSKNQVAVDARNNATLERVGRAFANITAPLLAIPEEHMKVLRDAMQPLLKDVVQFVTEKLGKPQKGEYSNLQFNVEKEASDLQGRLSSALPQETKSLHSALANFSDLADAMAKEKFPGLVDQLPRMMTTAEPATSIEQLLQYMIFFVPQKAGPILLSEAFPEVAKVLPVLMSRPTNVNDIDFWVKNIAMPALPESCRNATELLDTAAIAKAKDGTDLFGRFASFAATMQKCTAALLPQPEAVAMEAMPEAPKLPCLTCGQYGKLQIAVRCTGLCGHVLSNCMSSRNDECMHGAASCLDCVETQAQAGACALEEADAKLITKLSGFRTAMKHGSLEEEELTALADAVSDVLLNATA